MLKKLIAIILVLFTVACSTQPKVAPVKPNIKSIAIVPATDPPAYTFLNVSALAFLIPLSQTLNYADSKAKAKLFNERLRSQPTPLAEDLTAEVAGDLRALGYRVQILSNVSRPPDNPDDVDISKISTNADAILQLSLTEVGLFSPRSSTEYLPRVNARGTLTPKGQEDDIYDEDIYYGVDAKPDKPWAILSDSSFAYPDFDSVLSHIDGIRQAFEIGTREIAKRLSDHIRASTN